MLTILTNLANKKIPEKSTITELYGLLKIFQRTRHYFRNMDCSSLMPPHHVRGMMHLERDKFRKVVQVPMLDISDISINSVLPHLKKLLLKMERFKPVRTMDDGKKKLLLHPLGVKGCYDLPDEVRNLGITGSHLTWEDLELNYDNWKAEEILKAVLPLDQDALTSFSRIGHIIHINLRDHLLEYKQLIGEVLKDKVPHCRSVVNKSQTIDNTFRNFQLELVCGEADYKVEVKENGVIFEFDFSTVYWNPRLATEHERIIKSTNAGDIFYDIFAGVGPFSIPVAKKKCHVLANDLNPESFRWLQHNAKRNKVLNQISTYNQDGRDFIQKVFKDDLLKQWETKAEDKNYKIHVTMNLPAMAAEFLDAFCGLYADLSELPPESHRVYPLVHVYCFAKGDNSSDVAKCLVEQNLGIKFDSSPAMLEGVHFVRNVAPNKDMFRVSFYLTSELLCTRQSKSVKRSASTDLTDQVKNKKIEI